MFDHETAKKRCKYRLVILEGAQAVGKTTLASYAMERFENGVVLRGIPTSRLLESFTEEQKWAESKRIMVSASEDNDYRTAFFDRSIISLAAYRMRKYPSQKDMYLCKAAEEIDTCLDKARLLVVLLESSPETCLQRKARNYSILESPLADVQNEIDTYRAIINFLENRAYQTKRLNNENGLNDLKKQFITVLQDND